MLARRLLACRWVGILAFGEGWHNNHHAFEFSARHGLEWWQVSAGDVGKYRDPLYSCCNCCGWAAYGHLQSERSVRLCCCRLCLPCILSAPLLCSPSAHSCFTAHLDPGPLPSWPCAQFDMTWMVIKTLEAFGLASNLKLPTEKQKERLRFKTEQAPSSA